MTTLSVAATTFVGQNVGAGNWTRARQGMRTAMAMATVITLIILVPLMLFARPMCALFNQEPEVLDYGVYFIRLISPFYLLANFNQIYAGGLRGAGDAKMPMFIMLGSFVVFRQIYLFLTYRLAGTLLPVALGYPVGWIMCSAVLFFYYRSGKWVKNSFVVLPEQGEGEGGGAVRRPGRKTSGDPDLGVSAFAVFWGRGEALPPLLHHAHVSRADDLVHAHQLLDAVGAPAHDAAMANRGV